MPVVILLLHKLSSSAVGEKLWTSQKPDKHQSKHDQKRSVCQSNKRCGLLALGYLVLFADGKKRQESDVIAIVVDGIN